LVLVDQIRARVFVVGCAPLDQERFTIADFRPG